MNTLYVTLLPTRIGVVEGMTDANTLTSAGLTA
jgi:hypothetical protein